MAKRTTRKKTTRKTTARKKTARKTTTRATPSYKIPSSDKPRTKSEVFSIIAENTGLTRKQVSEVFEVTKQMIAKDLKKRGPEAFNLGGMMKVTVQRKPAVPRRKGINPFTGEEQWFKPKPARNVVKVRPLKALKDLV
ncbi:MAG: HU family DNA-binding protein [Phycisphaerales bacterium JB043]